MRRRRAVFIVCHHDQDHEPGDQELCAVMAAGTRCYVWCVVCGVRCVVRSVWCTVYGVQCAVLIVGL